MLPPLPYPPGPRGRLAPSPTGCLHLGNAYAFLMAWLSVRSQGGTLVLRMEDIDPERSKAAFTESILDDLNWLGITWDEGPDKGGPCAPYTQSARLERYAGLLDELRARGLVYPCYCTRKELRMLASAPHIGDEGVPYPGTCRTLGDSRRAEFEANGRRPSLRLNTEASGQLLAGGEHAEKEEAPLCFIDGVLGKQRFTMRDCGGDFPLCRSDGVVAYQLAVVADDAAMGITEVVRGDDLLLSTPRQVLLFRLLDRKAPVYAHVPLLHDPAGERLAKRHKSLELSALRGAGVAPEAVVGYLGWLAGWRIHPEPARPGDLLADFSLASLTGRHMRLPDNVEETLLRMTRHC